MDTPRASARGIRAGANLIQPTQARDYAQHLRELAGKWDAAADLCERLRAEAGPESAVHGRASVIPAIPAMSSTPTAAPRGGPTNL